ncbi:MAG: hypothetical protein WBL20_08140, partial [Sphingobium sp.]
PVVNAAAAACHARDAALERALLVTLYERGGPMAVGELEAALRCTRRDLFRAVRSQHGLGNLRKGPSIALTASARFAIAAGRTASCDWRNAA